MTADTNNLLMKSNYQGGSQVQVGNGQAVPITHIGMSFIPSNSSYRVLQLKNMLCVKKIAKNFLSISQITKDNDVIVEFHSDHCLIKDKATRAVLLQGERWLISTTSVCCCTKCFCLSVTPCSSSYSRLLFQQ